VGLDFRGNDGVEVALFWRIGGRRLIVEVVDTKIAGAFGFEVDASEALRRLPASPRIRPAFRGVKSSHQRSRPSGER
jgi:hypothetical protein